MQLVLVQIHVKPECVEAFKAQTLLNVKGSLAEPGIVRFDFNQQADDPTRFVLYEVYRDQAAVLAHKETAHYKAWRDAVGDMMAATRIGTKLVNVHPDDANW